CLVQLIEDRALRELAGKRRVVAGVPEGGAGEQVEAVGKRLRRRRGEVVVAHREGAVQGVVEGQVRLIVKTHRAAAGRIARADGVGRREAVHPATVDLAVGAVPGVVEIGYLAVVGLVKDSDRAPIRISGIGITGAAGLRNGPWLSLEVESSEIAVERAVLLH